MRETSVTKAEKAGGEERDTEGSSSAGSLPRGPPQQALDQTEDGVGTLPRSRALDGRTQVVEPSVAASHCMNGCWIGSGGGT